jgi:hypothetical protein
VTTPFTDSIVGQQGTLMRSQIKSPNFSLSAGTGWAILKNGNAYFFQVTTSGSVIIGGTNGWFIYNGTPGPGNPPVEYGVANGVGTDPFGNALPAAAGVVSVNPGVAYAQLVAGGLALGIDNGTDVSAFAAIIGISGSTSGQAVDISSGVGPEAGGAPSSLSLADSGGSAAAGPLQLTNPSGFTGTIGQAIPATVAAGVVSGNVASATISAGDAIPGAIYEMVAWGSIAVGAVSEIQTFNATLNGLPAATANGPIANQFSNGAVLRWQAHAFFQCVTKGAGGTWQISGMGNITVIANNIQLTVAADNSVPFAIGSSTAFAVSTIANITAAITYASSAGQACTATGGFLRRVL